MYYPVIEMENGVCFLGSTHGYHDKNICSERGSYQQENGYGKHIGIVFGHTYRQAIQLMIRNFKEK